MLYGRVQSPEATNSVCKVLPSLAGSFISSAKIVVFQLLPDAWWFPFATRLTNYWTYLSIYILKREGLNGDPWHTPFTVHVSVVVLSPCDLVKTGCCVMCVIRAVPWFTPLALITLINFSEVTSRMPTLILEQPLFQDFLRCWCVLLLLFQSRSRYGTHAGHHCTCTFCESVSP